MAIRVMDGGWWYGNEAGDIEAFLKALSARTYVVEEFRQARCECGSVTFAVEANDPQGVARRICEACGRKHFICDSAQFWEAAEPEKWGCECGSRLANVGVGFSFYDEGEIKWLYVGLRCVGCGMLGAVAGWKVGYGPSRQLMDQV